MTHFYLAAPFYKRDEAKVARDYIEANLVGWECTSRWLDHHLTAFDELDPAVASGEADNDIEDILEAEVMVFLNLGPSEGKMFELGYAVADDIPIVFIGTPTHIFHHLEGLERYETVEEFIRGRRA